MHTFRRFFPFIFLGYHLGFSYVAWKFILENNGDAKKYAFVNRDISTYEWLDFLKPGTDIIYLFTYPLVKYLQMPFWMGFLLFSLIGFAGFYLLWKLLLKISNGNLKLLLLGSFLLMLPNAHFWTSLIGKEPVLFLALSLVATEVYQNKFKSWKLFLGFMMVLLIRPHVAGLLIFSGMMMLLLSPKLETKKKLILGGFSAVLLAGTALVLQNVAKGKGNLFNKITYLYEAHIRVLKRTEAYVPLDEYVFPYKVFTFYFRPFPYEKSGFYYQVVSWENMVLLMVFLLTVILLFKKWKIIENKSFILFAGVFILAFAAMYVFAYANYGLILRTKVMVFPFCFLAVVTVICSIFKKNPA